jgi:hypothetical protein
MSSKTLDSQLITRMILGIATCCFVAWAVLFIHRSSFVAIDGQRYYSLFDDGMISMRYGWNFAHGAGLVWNVGERIEGYTNPLMTLYMALASLIVNDKRLAVLPSNSLALAFCWVPLKPVPVLQGAWLKRDRSGSSAPQDSVFVLVLPIILWLTGIR